MRVMAVGAHSSIRVPCGERALMDTIQCLLILLKVTLLARGVKL
jgi:hypothetical protein